MKNSISVACVAIHLASSNTAGSFIVSSRLASSSSSGFSANCVFFLISSEEYIGTHSIICRKNLMFSNWKDSHGLLVRAIAEIGITYKLGLERGMYISVTVTNE